MHKLFVVRTDLLGKGVETIYATQLGNTLKGLREWSRLSASLPGVKRLRGWRKFSAPLPGGEGLREWRKLRHLLSARRDSSDVREMVWAMLWAMLRAMLFRRDKDGDRS